MSSLIRPCRHTKAEEQYICLESTCLKQSEYKLNCFNCLRKTHPHEDFFYHVQDILAEALENQQIFNQMIDTNLKFCENISSKIEQNLEEMKQKTNQWLDQQCKSLIEQVQKYQFLLDQQKLNFSKTQLDESQIKNIIDFKLLDKTTYEMNNQITQRILESNESSFSHYFAVQFENISKSFYLHFLQTQELPQISQVELALKTIKIEKCQKMGCCTLDKNMICLQKSCLLNQNLTLECPSCQTRNHCQNNTLDEHNKYFKKLNELQELQNQYIKDLEKFCEEKSLEIQKQSTQLQFTVTQCKKAVEYKLDQFLKYVKEKEKEILHYIKIFKGHYKQDEFKIHRDLLLQKDFSIIADIVQLENNFKQLINSFTAEFKKENELEQLNFNDLWLKGMSLFQKDNICYLSKDFINPISLHIQGKNDELSKLTAENLSLSSINTDQQKKIEELTITIQQKNAEFEKIDRLEKMIEQFKSVSEKGSSGLLDKINEMKKIITDQPKVKVKPPTLKILSFQFTIKIPLKLAQLFKQVLKIKPSISQYDCQPEQKGS